MKSNLEINSKVTRTFKTLMHCCGLPKLYMVVKIMYTLLVNSLSKWFRYLVFMPNSPCSKLKGSRT